MTKPALVVSFDAQYTQPIARRVHEAKIYSEMVARDTTTEEIKAKNPVTPVLSGGPFSTYAEGTPKLNPEWLELDIPVFGICYGLQAMTEVLGGTIVATGDREYGRTQLSLVSGNGVAHAGVPKTHEVQTGHGDAASKVPEGLTTTVSTKGAPVAAFECLEKRMVGVQCHPEVNHSPCGQQALGESLYETAGLEPDWIAAGIAEELIGQAHNQVGETDCVTCGLSGGVDSAVTTALVRRAIDNRPTCVFADHRLLRQSEREQVEKDFVIATGAKLITVDDSKILLDALTGITDPKAKRKIIGREFAHSFKRAVAQTLEDTPGGETVDFPVQGTPYPNVVESGSGSGTANIKNHHNVDGLPDDAGFTLVELLCLLFRDEVRAVGRELDPPEETVTRQPFPGPGLGIRIIGAVSEERLDTLRRADAIMREEMTAAGMDEVVRQCPVVLLVDVRSVGVQGDGRTYGHPIVLRPVSSEDAVTVDQTRVPYNTLEEISARVTNEVPEVSRAVLDVISKPPGTIEWE